MCFPLVSVFPVTIKPISQDQLLPLRQKFLRKGRPLDECKFACDTHPRVFHCGAFVDSKLVGIATVAPEMIGDVGGNNPWRLRGMAVEESIRQCGVGRALVQAVEQHCHINQVDLLWCNARVKAVPFYQALGFHNKGGEFDEPGIGPHIRMYRVLVDC